ncbi:MAG: hypothetical protein KAI33_00920, partial [Elusimicrobiales bacterium]|nr:hypothetical protein [Elusimicrobiales bacterium]
MIKFFIPIISAIIFLNINFSFAMDSDKKEDVSASALASGAEQPVEKILNADLSVKKNIKSEAVKTKTLTAEIAKLTKKAFDDIYAIRVEEADKAVDAIIKKYPKHPFGHFGKAMTAWARFEYQQERSNAKLDDEYVKLTDRVAKIGEAW